jgi:glycosyltransferase involved in cell wall biosynthesis
MRRLVLVGLYPAKNRYTARRNAWIIRRLKARGFTVVVVEPPDLPGDGLAHKGRIFDPYTHPRQQLAQSAEIVRMIGAGEIGPEDVLWLDDLTFHGMSAIFRALSERFGSIENWPDVVVWVHANTLDPADFTRDWVEWMRPWEHMIDAGVRRYLVAGASLAERMQIVGMRAPHIVGHVFDSEDIRSTVAVILPLNRRTRRICFSSRMDPEKFPWFLFEFIVRSGLVEEGYEFAIATGLPELRSADQCVVERALDMERRGLLRIYTGLTKPAYHALMADSVLHFMCSIQDTVSYVLLEASALSTPSLCPCHLDFPETLNRNPRQLYVPGNVDDAIAKARLLLADPPDEATIRAPSIHHDGTMDRIADVLLGKGDRCLYRGPVHAAHEDICNG